MPREMHTPTHTYTTRAPHTDTLLPRRGPLQRNQVTAADVPPSRTERYDSTGRRQHDPTDPTTTLRWSPHSSTRNNSADNQPVCDMTDGVGTPAAELANADRRSRTNGAQRRGAAKLLVVRREGMQRKKIDSEIDIVGQRIEDEVNRLQREIESLSSAGSRSGTPASPSTTLPLQDGEPVPLRSGVSPMSSPSGSTLTLLNLSDCESAEAVTSRARRQLVERRHKSSKSASEEDVVPDVTDRTVASVAASPDIIVHNNGEQCGRSKYVSTDNQSIHVSSRNMPMPSKEFVYASDNHSLRSQFQGKRGARSAQVLAKKSHYTHLPTTGQWLVNDEETASTTGRHPSTPACGEDKYGRRPTSVQNDLVDVRHHANSLVQNDAIKGRQRNGDITYPQQGRTSSVRVHQQNVDTVDHPKSKRQGSSTGRVQHQDVSDDDGSDDDERHRRVHQGIRQKSESCVLQPDDDDDDGDDSDDDRRRRKRSKGRGHGNRQPRRRRRTPVSSHSRSKSRSSASRRSRMSMKPNKFDGRTSFETFLCTFVNCARYNRWTEEDKLAYMQWCLEGEAAQLLWDADGLTYDQLLEKLRDRFGGKGMEEKYQTELRCRRRRHNEPLRELAQDIRRLMALAYPGERSKLAEHIARDAFLQALDDYKLQLKVREREPDSLEAAVKYAQRIEVAQAQVEATTSAQSRFRSARQVAHGDSGPTENDPEFDARVSAAVERQLRQVRTEARSTAQSADRRDDNSQYGRVADHVQSSHSGLIQVDHTNKQAHRSSDHQSQVRRKSRDKPTTKDKKLNRAVDRDATTSQVEQLTRKVQELTAAQTSSQQQTAKLAAENDALNKELSRMKYLEHMQMAQATLSGPPQPTTQPRAPGGGDRPRQPGVCWLCNEPGHRMRSCPYGQSRQQGVQPGPLTPTNSYVGGTSRSGDDAFSRATYLRAQVGGREQLCLLDSGSEVTLLPIVIVDRSLVQPTQETLKAANGTEIPVLGKATVPFSTDRFTSTVTGLVSDHVSEVMLGIDWLMENNAAWDFRGASIQLGGQPHRLTVRRDTRKWCRRVVLQEDVRIPARSELDVPCKVVFQRRPANVQDVHWATQPTTIANGVHVARTLTPVDKYINVPVRIINVHRQPRLVRAGTVVSDMEPTSVLENSTNSLSQQSDIGETTLKRTTSKPVSDQMYKLIEDLVDGVDAATPESSVLELRELLLRNVHVFSESEFDLGRTDIVTHRIITDSARPVRQQLRKFPPAQVEAIAEHVDNMLRQQVIEPAASPWASNVVLVRKKDGTYRCCIDYRQLNNVTIKDAYPLPRLDSCLDAMADARWFSTFDLRSSYHQVCVAPEDRDKTAFICPRGMYRFRTMPFGLCNAGATFQRLMDIVMSGLHLEICLVYLDDIVVYATTAEQHLERLQLVFDRLSSAGLKLKPEKCHFFRRSVSFLGHVISHEGIGTDPAKTAQVAEWPVPTSLSELRTFLGLSSYYRRFVQNFAKIAAPLHDLTKKNVDFRWSSEAQNSFEALKVALTTPPVLAMPTDEGEFTLDTDASDRTIGAVLSQRQRGEERVIAYASRSLDRREQNYCVTRKELLAIVHFLKYFKQYLLGRKFKVRTDHAALSWLRRTPDPIGQQARWLEQMEEYDFTVEHRPGIRHANADAMSRRPCPKKDCACRELGSSLFGGPADQPTAEPRLIAGTAIDENAVQYVFESDGSSTQARSPADVTSEGLWSLDAIRAAQRNDDDISFVYDLVNAGSSKPSWNDVSAKSKEVKVLWSFWPRLVVRDGLLQRRFESVNGHDVHWQIIWPKKLRDEFLKLIHAGATCGHQGFKKTAAAIQARAYWPSWSSDLATFLKRCPECARYHRGVLRRQAEMQIPLVGEPWERVSVDITGPHPKSARQNQFILTVVDHFSKWAEAIPIRNHTAPTVARALLVHVFSRFGMPIQLLTDRGPEFESELFKHLMEWLEIDKLRTTAYKPSTNGIAERFHRTLNSMLGKVVSESQRDWDDRLPFVMAAYRATPHSSTGFSPNRLFLGHENRMAVDVVMGLPTPERRNDLSVDDYVARQQEMAEESYELARQHLRVNAERRKSAYDVHVRKTQFAVGDWVWYFNPRRYSRRSPKWQRCYTGPFLVVRELPPVNYVLQKSPKSQSFVVHCDKIKKCYSATPVNWLAEDTAESSGVRDNESPSQRASTHAKVGRHQRRRCRQPVIPALGEDHQGSQPSVRDHRTHKTPTYLSDYIC